MATNHAQETPPQGSATGGLVGEVHVLNGDWDLGDVVQDLGFRVQGLGFRVQDLGFRDIIPL